MMEATTAARAHEGPTLDSVGDYTVIDCQGCQFAHVVPLPAQSDIDSYYANDYYEKTKPHYFRDAEEDRGWWELVYEERLAMIGEWIPTPGKLLDVGSGPGLFLHCARRKGWVGLGLEPSAAARHYSIERFGLDVIDGNFTDDIEGQLVGPTGAGMPPRFDAINFGEVLEHVADPADALRRAYRMLIFGGVLLVIVPNDYSALQGAVEKHGIADRWWLSPPAHLNYFNVRSLHGLLKRCGFVVADMTCTFPLELFILMGLNYVGDSDVGRQIHGMRKRLEIALEQTGLGQAKRDLYREFARRGIGRDIVMLARRQ